MKLKKIASLALAGIMAVSMLAGCGEGISNSGSSSSGNTNNTNDFTSVVLSKVNDQTAALVHADSKTKLDEAITFTATNDTTANVRVKTTIEWANATWNSKTLAESKMNGAGANFSADLPTQSNNFNVGANGTLWSSDLPQTYWTLGIISATVDDNTIAEMVADVLDKLTYAVDNDEYDYDYAVRVAKSVCKNTDLSSANDDYVVVGVSLTCNRTEIKY